MIKILERNFGVKIYFGSLGFSRERKREGIKESKYKEEMVTP